MFYGDLHARVLCLESKGNIAIPVVDNNSRGVQSLVLCYKHSI